MPHKHLRLPKANKLIGLPILIAISGLAFAATSRNWINTGAKATETASTQAEQQRPPQPPFAVDRGRLDRHVIRALDALGNRFESLAQGRSIVTATFTRSKGEPSQFTIIRELPDKLRIEETGLTTQRTIGHDGNRPWTRAGSLSAEDLRVVESIVRDSVEHFIAGQARGDATLHLGDMFRADDGSNQNYDGPFHDILRVDDAFETPEGTKTRPTLFYLDSRTGLLEKIVYEREEGKIEVEFGGWITIANQKTPGRIVWKENGSVTNQLVITHVAFSPVVQDGTFTAPESR
jgi:hypothetical protein